MRSKIYKITNSVPLLLVMVMSLSADRGMIPVMPGVSIYEPGQKAIIAWNGKKEILILSTDVYADGETKVLEILPLPAKPEVKEGSFKSFEAIQELIGKNMPPFPMGRPEAKLAADTDKKGVEVLFYEEIGAHSITCVKATDWDEFTEWVQDYIEGQGLSSIVLPDTFSEIVENYIKNMFPYFVFDITEIGVEAKSVEPIVYTFKTDYLFFPLEISSIVAGETDISLFLLTKEPLDLLNTGTALRPGTYYRQDFMRLPIDALDTEEAGGETGGNIIGISVAPREQKDIHRDIDLMFWGNVHLGVLHYHGSTKGLRNDLLMR
jgi:hypothetical protein